MGDVPESHPRFASLMARKKLTEAANAGLLADSALIAHGRGEAFDYLLQERTCETARLAIRECAARLQAAKNPVISVNGNTVALAGTQLLACAAVLGCAIEVNIYYRTPERMSALLSALDSQKSEASLLYPELKTDIVSVRVLGGAPDARIPNLEGPRANCHTDGIYSSDVILVPLEDGDRCEALVAMGKTVCVIDLNPLSRTAKTATITIVDELTRCVPILLDELRKGVLAPNDEWDNEINLNEATQEMLRVLD
ncbi:MAG: phosphopantothenate/pantothenate synthetase [Candidatus Thermoplasmatota archaeon]|nr:phosphopantothenate/pantothenate synthetase [Candidatus Thermoplasmatota archaeon]